MHFDQIPAIINIYGLSSDIAPVSYTHLDVYKRQMLDRSNPLFPSDYAFRDIYLLATAADTEPTAMNGAIKGLQGWVDCFNKASLKGVVRGLGADALGSIAGNPALEEAYQTGLNL